MLERCLGDEGVSERQFVRAGPGAPVGFQLARERIDVEAQPRLRVGVWGAFQYHRLTGTAGITAYLEDDGEGLAGAGRLFEGQAAISQGLTVGGSVHTVVQKLKL